MSPTWIASYPRSGNTYLRTILNHCFGLKSGSIYAQDLGGNKQLEQYVGHIEHNSRGGIEFTGQNIPLVKTHELNSNADRAIYILRDARPTALSLFKFYKASIPLEQIILGNHDWGKWCDHVTSWSPRTREKTLFLKYEDLLSDKDTNLQKISNFLKVELISSSVPDRNKIASIDGRWVNQQSNWEDEMPKEAIKLCSNVNQEKLEEFEYL